MEINDCILEIKKLGACKEAVAYAYKYKTPEELWAGCERGDWMLWLIGKLSGEPKSEKRKKLVLTACKCARLALLFAGKNKDVCEKSIESAENWAKGMGSIQNVQNAANAAYAAAYAADAAYAAERKKILKQCADIVRADYPFAELICY
jgi:hypothetical protein